MGHGGAAALRCKHFDARGKTGRDGMAGPEKMSYGAMVLVLVLRLRN